LGNVVFDPLLTTLVNPTTAPFASSAANCVRNCSRLVPLLLLLLLLLGADDDCCWTSDWATVAEVPYAAAAAADRLAVAAAASGAMPLLA